PSGSFSDITVKAATDLGYRTVMWSKDTIDWRDKDEELIVKRATQNLNNGDIILMHPKPHTLSALPEIIEKITESGFSIVTVGENLGD
ncbi:MAG: polysaccharide deacetylase, partial [Clostridia bacterium]|nr:polysaccharide deacetylase [Clostridia bacterium]